MQQVYQNTSVTREVHTIIVISARSTGRTGGSVEHGATGFCSAGDGRSGHIHTDCSDRHSRAEGCLTHHHSYITQK